MDVPRRPRWRRKRWLAAGLLWLAVGYPASYGPVAYAVCRDWILGAAYAPDRPIDRLLDPALGDPHRLSRWYYDGSDVPPRRLARRRRLGLTTCRPRPNARRLHRL